MIPFVTRARIALGAIAFAAAGCTAAPPTFPVAGPDPADAAVPVPPVTDISTIGAYTSYRPVSPRPWREQNERVAPGAQP